VGEFSFVLARRGVIPPAIFSLTLATALVTILLAPSLLRAGPFLVKLLEGLPVVGARFAAPVVADRELESLRQHTVICGSRRVGRELADALERRSFRYLVVDYNPLVVRELRNGGVPVIYGDASNPAVLDHANPQRARVWRSLCPTREPRRPPAPQ
jgi:uncharacterized protein with HEPN domain/predicted nucleotidyltransferase